MASLRPPSPDSGSSFDALLAAAVVVAVALAATVTAAFLIASPPQAPAGDTPEPSGEEEPNDTGAVGDADPALGTRTGGETGPRTANESSRASAPSSADESRETEEPEPSPETDATPPVSASESEDADDSDGTDEERHPATVGEVRTDALDTDGDGLDDRLSVEATVSASAGAVTTVGFNETGFGVDVSPTNTTDGEQARFVSSQDPDDDGDDERVRFTSVGGVDTNYTVVADLSGQSEGDTGGVKVGITGGDERVALFTVDRRSTADRPSAELLTVVTGKPGDTVRSVGPEGSHTDTANTTPSGEAVVSVPAERPAEVLVNGEGEAMAVGGGRLDLTPTPDEDGFTTDSRVVESGETVFLGEEIDKNDGVFSDADIDDDFEVELVSPIMFRSRETVESLFVPGGVVDPDNEQTMYGIDPDNDGVFDRTVFVREPRVQAVRLLDEEGRRLGRLGETPTVEAGESNLQVAVNYNFFGSTGIGVDGLLTRDGVDVTERFLEREPADANLTTRDRGVDGTKSADGSAGPEIPGADGGAYDAVFTFGVDEPGEYTVSVGPEGFLGGVGGGGGSGATGNATREAAVRVTSEG